MEAQRKGTKAQRHRVVLSYHLLVLNDFMSLLFPDFPPFSLLRAFVSLRLCAFLPTIPNSAGKVLC